MSFKLRAFVFSLLLASSLTVQAQYSDQLVLKIGLNYVFTGKNTELKSGLTLKAAATYQASDYLSVGPQLSLSKFFGADRVKYKNPTYFEIAPLLQFDLTKWVYNDLRSSGNQTYPATQAMLNLAPGFNIDKNTANRKRFTFSSINVGADLFSNKVLNKKMYLNAGLDMFFNREQIRNAIAVGLGGAISLKE